MQENTQVVEVVMPKIVEPSGLVLRHRPVAEPAAGQLLVRVEATGISFAEQSMRRGRYPAGQPRFPFVPGYDLVGIVVQVGPGVSADWLGKRIAALTKTGGWTNLAIVPEREALPLPENIDAAEAETLVVNGITAWQMLHRSARVPSGQTILVHGANGGVGTTLVQLALAAGVRVIGTASPRHHDALRENGVLPLDYKDPNLLTRIRQLAPEGVAAAFDPIGGEGVKTSFKALAPGGTLVSYGTAVELNGKGSILVPFLTLTARLLWWNLLPNQRKATFYNIWAGHTIAPTAFFSRLREDFGQIIALLQRGTLSPQIAARFPLSQVTAAMELAESRTVYGKVILTPSEG
jgi:NADPH:quinone reductase-like Zn-dependent oxidoreductase